MDQFVQPLESRCLLSASTLAMAEAKVGTDVWTIIADAKTAETTVKADAKGVVAQLKALNIKNTPLGKALTSDLTSAANTVKADVSRIVSAGAKDAEAVFADYLNTLFANPSNLAKDQLKLANDVKTLWKVEQPLLGKLAHDLGSSLTKVENAAQAIVNANKSDAALVGSWSTLETALGSSQTTLSVDFSDLAIDVNAMIADI